MSDGAISFYLDHFVRTRVSKVAYGSFCHIAYDPTDPEHRARESKTFMSVSSSRRLGGFFQVVLPKNTQVSEEKEFKYQFWYEFDNKNSLKNVKSEVWCYKGNIAEPKWRDTDTGEPIVNQEQSLSLIIVGSGQKTMPSCAQWRWTSLTFLSHRGQKRMEKRAITGTLSTRTFCASVRQS